MYIYEALNQCEQKPVIGSLVKFQGAKDLGVPGLPSSYEGVVLDTNGDYHVVRVLKETPITVSGEKEYRIHPEPWTEDTYRLPHECISAVSMFTVNL